MKTVDYFYSTGQNNHEEKKVDVLKDMAFDSKVIP